MNLLDLIKTCEPFEYEEKSAKDGAAEMAELLNELGFAAGVRISRALSQPTRLAEIARRKFVVITEQKIRDFINNLNCEAQKEALQEVRKIKSITRVGKITDRSFKSYFKWDKIGDGGFTDHDLYQDYAPAPYWMTGSSLRETFEWREVETNQYLFIPPKDVLLKMKEVRALNLFDYFTIASVAKVKDPLLLGRIKEDNRRWFLAQWGDDVTLDDLI